MNFDAIVSFVQAVGFPIAITIYLLWDRRQSDLEHKTEIDKLSDALHNNTSVLEKILEHFRKGEEGEG